MVATKKVETTFGHRLIDREDISVENFSEVFFLLVTRTTGSQNDIWTVDTL